MTIRYSATKIKNTAHTTCLTHPLAKAGFDGPHPIVEILGTGDVLPGEVLKQYSKVVVLPIMTTSIPWAAIAGKPQGAIVKIDAHGV